MKPTMRVHPVDFRQGAGERHPVRDVKFSGGRMMAEAGNEARTRRARAGTFCVHLPPAEAGRYEDVASSATAEGTRIEPGAAITIVRDDPPIADQALDVACDALRHHGPVGLGVEEGADVVAIERTTASRVGRLASLEQLG
jgi:hypothetical protein